MILDPPWSSKNSVAWRTVQWMTLGRIYLLCLVWEAWMRYNKTSINKTSWEWGVVTTKAGKERAFVRRHLGSLFCLGKDGAMNMTFVSVAMTVLLLSCERSNVKALFQCNYFGEEALGRDWVKSVLGWGQSLRCSILKEQQELISPPQLIFSLKKTNKRKGREGRVDTTNTLFTCMKSLKNK